MRPQIRGMRWAILILTALALTLGNLSAATLRFSTGAAARFSFTVPEGWTTDVDKDGTLEAYPADQSLYLAAWEVEDMTDLRSPTDSLPHLLRDCATQIKLTGAPEKSKLGAFPALLFSGTGQDADDGKSIRFFALLVTTGPEDAAVIYLQAGADASQEELDILKAILASLKSP